MKSNQLGRHIVTKHAMTTAEYKKRFPFAKVAQLSKKQLEKMISTKPLKASKNKTSLQERKLRQYVWQHDLRKFEYLKSSGYNVLVVWENERKRQSQTVKERIKDAYNRTP